MSIYLKITGLDEFIQKIDSRLEVRGAIDKGIKKIVFFLEGEAKVFTPVDTGVLRNSFRSSFGALEGKLFNIRDYGVFVHEGTRFVKGRPFMTDAAKNNAREINLIMNEELSSYLKILK